MTRTCPDCGAEKVTFDPDEGTILGHPIEDFVFEAEDGDELSVTAACWSCGWEEHKALSIEVHS